MVNEFRHVLHLELDRLTGLERSWFPKSSGVSIRIAIWEDQAELPDLNLLSHIQARVNSFDDIVRNCGGMARF